MFIVAENTRSVNITGLLSKNGLIVRFLIKALKFGTVVVYSITKDISYDPKQNRSKIWYLGVKQ